MSEIAGAKLPGESPRADRPGVVLFLGCLSLLLALVVSFQAVVVYQQFSEATKNSKKWAKDTGNSIAETLDSNLVEVATIAKNLADEVRSQLADEIEGRPCRPCQACSGCGVESILQSAYLNNTHFSSLGIAFGAFKSDPDVQLYAPFIQHHDVSKGKLQRIDHYYDYLSGQEITDIPAALLTDTASSTGSGGSSLAGEGWYQKATASRSHWMPPRFETSVSEYVIRYTVPVHHPTEEGFDVGRSTQVREQISGRDEIGVAFVDIDLEWLRQRIEQWDIGDNNYVVLFNELDQLIYHSLRGREEIVSGLRDGVRDCSLVNATDADKGVQADCYLISMKNANGTVGSSQLTGDPSWFHSHAIGSRGWRLLTVISTKPMQEFLDRGEKSYSWVGMKDRVAWVFWIVCTLVSGFSYYRMKRSRTTRKMLWIDSVVFTQIFLLGILTIWIWEHGTLDESNEAGRILSNQAMVNQFKDEYAMASLKGHRTPPIFVPVGLFVQSIEFISATNVALTGYIWHRYIEGQGINVTDGTIFPEAIATNIREAYQENIEGEVIKGWYFETTLRERFDPRRYPFDRQAVWVRLWHENIGENIVLVPDFKAYDSLSTRALPGVEKDFVLSGWTLFRSYFDMRSNSYNTSFGRSGFFTGDALPELYFNIEVKRNFLNPFISHFFPLFVVLLMLYAILVTTSEDEIRKEVL
ncbi:MAG: hypothetical protein O7G31_02015, partial [Calditrichaeota bacterium]|nr:hypothetical protein [Calditrichota bacterium]